LKKAFHPRSGEKKWGIDTESFPMGASVTRSSPRPAWSPPEGANVASALWAEGAERSDSGDDVKENTGEW